MTTYPTHQRPELVSQAALDDLFDDAQKWRDLTAELTARGHERMTTVEAIASVFPNFRAMAHALPTDTQPTAAPSLQGPPDPFLDTVRSIAAPLTPSGAEPYQKPPISIPGLEEMEIQPITYLESIFGPVIAGYTNDNLLAFAFEDLREVRTIPLTVMLANLVREMKRQYLKPKNDPTKSTRLM